MSTQWRPFDQNLPYETTYTLWNTLQLPQSLEHCLNCQLWALSRMSFKLGYPINTKKSAFLQTITFSICTRTKITVFNIIKERHNTRFFLPSGSFTEIIVANPNSTSTVKFSPCCSLNVTFFVLIRFPGRAAAAWPCLDFQNHDCIACCMYSHSALPCCDFQWSFFQIQEQQAKFANEVYLLTRFFEKVDSSLLSRWRLPIRQPLKMKNGYKLSQNRIQNVLEQLL